jgi:farnesyl diphosphate synthase
VNPRAEPVPLDRWLDETQGWTDRALERALEDLASAPPRLLEAVCYALLGPGKRLRPALVRLVCADLGGRDEEAEVPAAAIECVHAYSLVHDDLPCMDDDDLRHGKPTLHKAFDEATAVLAGDALHALAFEILSMPETASDPYVRADLVLTLAAASGAGGMAGGQMMDIVAAHEDFDLHAVTRLQQLKTGALLGAAVEMGAILGRLSEEGRAHLRAYARDIGLAFQIADDLLDHEGDEAKAGKALRKDADKGKATFVSLMGADQARQQAHALSEQAVGHLAGHGEEADLLRALARFVVERDR